MASKKCLVFETLNNVQGMSVSDNSKGEVRLSGVFGVCGVRNNNNRVYNKVNYGKMVESLQQQILTEGCPGELEHPNSMNITLENISHKIESIQMNEDGTITGTILLLNTPKGQIAKAIVEGGLPLFISSRGAGSIDESGNVTLSTIKTYDLVGTPGFSQAKLSLKENQTLECLNEGLDSENQMWAIIEAEDLLGDDSKSDDSDKNDDVDDKDKADDKKDEETKKDDKKEDDKKSSEPKTDTVKKDKKDKDNTDMTEILNAIKSLEDKVTNLQAELHIAKESQVNYDAIEKWVTEEFAPAQLQEIKSMVQESVNEATTNIAEGVEKWVCEEFAPEVQNWVCEEFAPEVQNWVCEEFAPEVQNWVCEEFAPTVENWVNEEFAPTVEKWLNEEFMPEHKESIVNEVNSNVSEFLESQQTSKFDTIDRLLESIDSEDKNVEKALEETQTNKFAGVYVIENMPAQYRPQWEMLDEAKQNEIIRSSRMYDFTKAGVLESFWANVKMNESSVQTETPVDYRQMLIMKAKSLR